MMSKLKLWLYAIPFLIFLVGCSGKIIYSDIPNPQQYPELKQTQPQRIQEQTNEVQQIKKLPVQTLGKIYASAENWDADADIDGITFSLRPANIKDDIVPISGTLTAQLKKHRCVDVEFSTCMKEVCDNKSKVIEEWEIPIRESDFGDTKYPSTPTMRLEYKKFRISSDKFEKGCLKVELKTGGKKFEVIEDSVYLNGW